MATISPCIARYIHIIPILLNYVRKYHIMAHSHVVWWLPIWVSNMIVDLFPLPMNFVKALRSLDVLGNENIGFWCFASQWFYCARPSAEVVERISVFSEMAFTLVSVDAKWWCQCVFILGGKRTVYSCVRSWCSCLVLRSWLIMAFLVN